MLNGLLLWQSMVPQGLAEQAELFARTSYPSLGPAAEIDPLIVSAAALLCVPRPDPTLLDRLEKRAQALPTVTGEWVVLQGLVAAVHGHLPAARLLFESSSHFPPAALSSFHRQIALEWLLADASNRGEVHRLKRLQQWPVDYAARTTLTGWIARALPKQLPAESSPIRWPEQGSTLLRAVGAHASVLALPSGQVTAETIERLGLFWRNALRDTATIEWIAQRATAAGLSTSNDALRQLQQTIRRDFMELLRLVPDAWDDILETSDLIPEALERLRHDTLHDLESATIDLDPRVEGKREKPLLDEWLEWNTLRQRFERIATRSTSHDRKICFDTIRVTVCNWGVWLANDRNQRAMAHAIFRWLAEQAEAVGETKSAELNRKNAEATA